MSRKRISFLLLIVLFMMMSFGGCGGGDGGNDGGGDGQEPITAVLITAAQLEKLINAGQVTVIDVRGSEKYNNGHITGALDIGISTLDAERNGIPMMLPDAEGFAAVMSKKGVTNNDFVVIYDEVGGSQSGRLAWMFLHFGHSKVALLNGAWGAWKGSVSTQVSSKNPSSYTVKSNKRLVASISDVKSALDNPKFVILDARTSSQYTGAEIESGAGRGGHIPGAVNINWLDNMDIDKFIKSKATLKALYEVDGVTPDKTIITYCHGGYRASFSAYILKELLGYPNVIMYDGSWLEWSNTKDPITVFNGNFSIYGYIENLTYSCSPSGESGVTCSKGSFAYKNGDKIVFKAGNVLLPEIVGKSAVNPSSYYPGNTIYSTEMLNLVRFLVSAGTLDTNGDIKIGQNPYNGKTGTFPEIWNELHTAGQITCNEEQAKALLEKSQIARYQGLYGGTWTNNSGGGSGEWDINIEKNGTISGKYNDGVLTGNVTTVDGDVRMTSSGGVVWTGKISIITGEISGTFTRSGGGSGAFSGVLDPAT